MVEMNIEERAGRSYRSEIRIIRDILSALHIPVMRGLRKTRLLYASNLNTTMGNIYIERLVSSRLISVDESSVYRLTSRGVRVLGLLNTVIRELEREDDGWSTRVSEALREISKKLDGDLVINASRRGVLGTHRLDALLELGDGDSMPIMLAESMEDVNNVMPWMLLAMLDLGFHKGLLVVRGRGKVRSISINSLILHLVEMAEPSIDDMVKALKDAGGRDFSAS